MFELTFVGVVVWLVGLVLAGAIVMLIFDIIFGLLYGAAWVFTVIERRWKR